LSRAGNVFLIEKLEYRLNRIKHKEKARE